MTENKESTRKMSPHIIAAIILGFCGLIGSLIGLYSVYGENQRLKNTIQALNHQLNQKSGEVQIVKSDYLKKEMDLTNSKNIAENKLSNLIKVIDKLNSCTLVNAYNSHVGWSGYEPLPCKGEWSLQCSVDRFFIIWNANVKTMIDSGCKGIKTKVAGVHHPECCN